jgi:uncharacterized iron-regulated protein
MLEIRTILPSLLLILATAGCETDSRTQPKPLASTASPPRAALWVDLMRGEPIEYPELTGDLAKARVVYLGEIHTIPRHHQLQKQILDSLAAQGLKLVLAMEQFEYFNQPVLDKFNSGAIDLDGLVRESDWVKRWSGHTNYHELILAAHARGVPLLALNARAETIRAIGRGGGITNLTAAQRQELPQSIATDDPVYERLLKKILGVHMALDPAKLQPAFEAQVARDESMANRLAEYLNSSEGRGRVAIVICGRGHCEFGLGTPARVARRIPGISQRIIMFSESGDLEMTEAERKQMREIEVSHEFLSDLGRPSADYLQVIEPARGSN